MAPHPYPTQPRIELISSHYHASLGDGLRLSALAADQGWRLTKRARSPIVELRCPAACQCELNLWFRADITIVAARGDHAINFVERARRAADLAEAEVAP